MIDQTKPATEVDVQREPRVYGPEYGPEAVRRLHAGYPISYRRDGLHIQENPDGRRYEIRVERDNSTTFLRKL